MSVAALTAFPQHSRSASRYFQRLFASPLARFHFLSRMPGRALARPGRTPSHKLADVLDAPVRANLPIGRFERAFRRPNVPPGAIAAPRGVTNARLGRIRERASIAPMLRSRRPRKKSER